MIPDVETPLLGEQSSRPQAPQSSVGKYIGIAAVLATTVIGILVLKGAVTTSFTGTTTTSLQAGSAFFNFHTATTTSDADGEYEAYQQADKLAAKTALKKAKSASVVSTSSNPDSVSGGVKMMSLVGATTSDNFNVCSSEYQHGEYLKVAVKTGCISLFNNDISKQSLSKVITFCGCENLGPKKYDMVSLQKAGLVSKVNSGMISFIATGEGASVTLYNDPSFDSGFKVIQV